MPAIPETPTGGGGGGGFFYPEAMITTVKEPLYDDVLDNEFATIYVSTAALPETPASTDVVYDFILETI